MDLSVSVNVIYPHGPPKKLDMPKGYSSSYQVVNLTYPSIATQY